MLPAAVIPTTLLRLLASESEGQRRRIVIMAALAGLANVALLAIINAAAGNVSQENMSTRYLFMFIVSLVLFVIAQREIFDRGTEVFEHMVERVRLRLVRKVQETDLLSLERLGSAEIYSKITGQTAVLSQAAGPIVAALQSTLMVAFASVYIASLSKAALLLSVVLVVGGVAVYLVRQREASIALRQAATDETQLFGLVTHAIEGFKEVKMSERRREELMGRLGGVAAELRDTTINTARIYNGNYIFAQSFFYILIAANVFLLPRIIPTYGEVVMQLTAAILFIIGPLSTAVAGIPAFAKANISAEEMVHLEDELDRHSRTAASPGRGVLPALEPGMAPRIELVDVEFSYEDRAGITLFTVGPVSLKVEPGELLFVVGGNGSGKSTLALLLTTLYVPQRGTLLCDGVPVTPENIQSYRERFSVIYSDFHLFDRLYGLDPDPEEVRELLRRFGLDGKTAFEEGRFTSLDLSTGQRKRLGLIVALLENRPVLVFDEWAADQDIEFRRYFYEELLPGLKQEGRTVVAITHDDRFFDIADRVVRMEYGQMLESAEVA